MLVLWVAFHPLKELDRIKTITTDFGKELKCHTINHENIVIIFSMAWRLLILQQQSLILKTYAKQIS